MTSDTKPRLSAVLTKLERHERIRQEFFAVDRELYELTDRRLIRAIDRLDTVARDAPWLWQAVVDLMSWAIRNRPRIPLQKRLAWVERLRRLGDGQALRDSLEALAQEGVYLPPRVVVDWVTDWTSGLRQKYAALTLLVGDKRYYRAATTLELCELLKRSVENYEGDHGVFRWFPMLLWRVRLVSRSAKAYPRCVEALATAIYATGSYDTFFLEQLTESLPKHLGATKFADVRSEINNLLRQDAARRSARRKCFRTLLAPATS